MACLFGVEPGRLSVGEGGRLWPFVGENCVGDGGVERARNGLPYYGALWKVVGSGVHDFRLVPRNYLARFGSRLAELGGGLLVSL